MGGEVFVPLSHPPGRAQVDFGEALARIVGVERDRFASSHRTCRASSQSLVRYKTNDYSVPVAHSHQEVRIRGHIHEVVIGLRKEMIARHPRCRERDDVVIDPIHNLPLIERGSPMGLSRLHSCKAGACRKSSSPRAA